MWSVLERNIQLQARWLSLCVTPIQQQWGVCVRVRAWGDAPAWASSGSGAGCSSTGMIHKRSAWKAEEIRDAADAAVAISSAALIETARRRSTALDVQKIPFLTSPPVHLFLPLYLSPLSSSLLLFFLLHHPWCVYSFWSIDNPSVIQKATHSSILSSIHPYVLLNASLRTHTRKGRQTGRQAPPPSSQPSWRRPSCLRRARPRRPPASRCRPRRRWTASRAGRCAEPGRGGPTARPSSATRAPRWSSLHCLCSKVRH